MNAALLDYSVHGNPKDPVSDRILADAFTRRGVPMAIVPLCRGEPPPPLPEHVVFRFDLRGEADWTFAVATAEALAARGHRLFPTPAQLLAAEDKWHTAAAFTRAGVAAPPTWLADAVPPFAGPRIVKPRVGWGGRGAVVLADEDALRARADLRHRGNVVQPFVPHDGTWIVALAGPDCIAVLADPGQLTGDARRPQRASPPPGLVALAHAALAAADLPAGTVDLVTGPAGPLVLEVNAAPCLTHPHLPDLDLAGPMADALLRHWGRA